MANTLKIKTGFKGNWNSIFTKVVNGADLNKGQETQWNNFINTFPTMEQPNVETEIEDIINSLPEPQQTEEPQAEAEELSLNNWMELTEEQQTTLKESLLKSLYGIGGEHFSTFPTLLDNKINTWVEGTYNISKLPKVGATQFKKWESHGTIRILPVEKGTKVHYLTILLPNKDIEMDIWELEKEGAKPFLKYTQHNLLGKVTLGGNNFHILNSYTNKNKAYNQGKALSKLFQMGTDIKELEAQKDLNRNYLQLDIQGGEWVLKEMGSNSHNPTGNTYPSIGHYLGREQHKDITTNYMELLQTI